MEVKMFIFGGHMFVVAADGTVTKSHDGTTWGEKGSGTPAGESVQKEFVLRMMEYSQQQDNQKQKMLHRMGIAKRRTSRKHGHKEKYLKLKSEINKILKDAK